MSSSAASIRVSACAAAVGLLLVGCGGGDAPAAELSDGPLAEFFGWDISGLGLRPALSDAERERQDRVEELVAECMAAAGLDYFPQLAADRHRDPHQEVRKLRRDDPEGFARQFGYGYSTMPTVGPTDFPDQDPNWAVRESLTPSQQEEYDLTLWGNWSDFQSPGCYQQAQQQVYRSGEEIVDEGRFDRLHEAWAALNQQIAEDSRLVSAQQDWAECMAGASFPGLTAVHQAEESVNQRMSEVYGWNQPESGPVDQAALAELQDYERAVALADYQCRRDHYQASYAEVRDELESRFLQEYRDELTAYRDWIGG